MDVAKRKKGVKRAGNELTAANCAAIDRQRAPSRKWEADDYLLVFTTKLLYAQLPDVVLLPQAICYNIHKQLARGRG